MNKFSNIISPELKSIYKNAIDEILSKNGLATQVKITYLRNVQPADDCNNCIVDPIYKKSTGRYNNTGPEPFTDGSICPVCNGDGYKSPNNDETCYMGVLTSEKSWIDIGLDNTKLPEGSIQTVCKADLAQKIKNSYSISIVDNNGINDNLTYERNSDIIYLGFGSHDYVITMWKRLR